MELEDLPGGSAMMLQAGGLGPWPRIAVALKCCTWFPSEDFHSLLLAGRFDVRWPLTFAAWYWGQTSASVDRECAKFLSSTGLLDQALAVLAEYAGSEWLSEWRLAFEERVRTAIGA